MKTTPETIVNDISGALGIPGDLIPDTNHNGKDYLSYRYRWNDNNCLLLIRVDEDSVEVNAAVAEKDKYEKALRLLVAHDLIKDCPYKAAVKNLVRS